MSHRQPTIMKLSRVLSKFEETDKPRPDIL